MNDLYLAHHGILGMKWGVRRYQNADGTRTEAGKRRYTYETMSKVDNAVYKNLGSSTGNFKASMTSVNKEAESLLTNYNAKHAQYIVEASMARTTTDDTLGEVARMATLMEFDDLDQGLDNSIAYYLEKTGKQEVASAIAEKYWNTFDNAKAIGKAMAESELDKYDRNDLVGDMDAYTTDLGRKYGRTIEEYTSNDTMAVIYDGTDKYKTDGDYASAVNIGKKLNIPVEANTEKFEEAVKNCGLENTKLSDLSDSDIERLNEGTRIVCGY